MKRFLANLMIAIGALAALSGLISTPLVQDQLPSSFMFPSDGQASHQYFRVVAVAPQGPDYLPYVLLLSGTVMLIIGVAFRRKFRGIAA
nr:putative integron gene cassette protein [uncultured bacterium]